MNQTIQSVLLAIQNRSASARFKSREIVINLKQADQLSDSHQARDPVTENDLQQERHQQAGKSCQGQHLTQSATLAMPIICFCQTKRSDIIQIFTLCAALTWEQSWLQLLQIESKKWHLKEEGDVLRLKNRENMNAAPRKPPNTKHIQDIIRTCRKRYICMHPSCVSGRELTPNRTACERGNRPVRM